jgi:membrane protein implicated in regulation of membrane protease activity
MVAVAILVLAPIVALMWVGSYAKDGPRLWGFPFFYWYQLMWVFIASGCTYLAYRLVHNARRGGDR